MLGDYYRKLNFITLILLFLLILAGGIVRSTGSGMGCPDWPKCFGEFIPPMDESELSENYKEDFLTKRKNKNIRLSRMLSFFGFNELSNKILNDKSIYVEDDFNVYKTWTEYLNRLLGAIVGFSILLTFISSFKYIKSEKNIFIFSLISLILVLFQAWIGSIVVSTKLMPGIITLHMIIALLIICLVIYTYFLSTKNKIYISKFSDINFIKYFIIINLVALTFQISLGTQIRESIDTIAIGLEYNLRNTWVDSLGIEFFIHRSFSLIILGLNLYLCYLFIINKIFLKTYLKIIIIILSLITLEIITGAGMAYFSIPSFLQPLHLFLAVLIFGLLFYMFLIIRFSIKKEKF